MNVALHPRRAVVRRLLTAVAAASALLALAGAPASGRGAGPEPVEQLYGTAVREIPTSDRVVALTFNAAWNEEALDTVLTVLRRENAPATFFLTGDFAERHPAAARRIAAAGHGLGNHSHTHPHFGEITREERAREVTRADTAIRRASGTEPLPFFRFPYGDTTPGQIDEVNALGFAVVEWTTDTNGYLGTAGGMTADKAVQRALDVLKPGAIIQMHVGSPNATPEVLDAEALPRLITAIRTRGYEITDLRTSLPTG
ncbi:polysaccharide deacetylase family protein [Streptomyces coeruleoprunus]|uniref:Polysaccharide deacetylase family protein n=1 Tax=Streptomyces coeruleoprunus TaxID=285563 RepID=A0ABV9XDS6_9ACTN